MIQLGNSDALFASLESSTTPQHAGCLGIYAPSAGATENLRFKDVLAWFERRLTDMPSLRMSPVLGAMDRYHRGRDECFDLEFHVRHLSLPKPGDWRQLCIQVARLHSRPLDPTRPLWECHVIEGLEHFPDCPPNSFAIYFKIHHKFFAGEFGLNFLASLHDADPTTWAGDAVRCDDGGRASSAMLGAGLPTLVGGSLLRQFRAAVPLTGSLLGSIWGIGDTLWRRYREELSPLQRGPRCRFDEPVGPHRAVEATTFSLSDFQAISKEAGTTLQAVAISVIGGAIRRYLEFYQELPSDSIAATLPIHKDARVSGSSRIEAIAVQLHTELSDPVERLAGVRRSLSQAKAHLDTPLADPLYLLGLIPVTMPRVAKASRWVSRRSWDRHWSLSSATVIASLAGPDIPQYCAGAELVHVYWLGMLAPDAGLFHTVLHYRGRLSFGILADRDAMPDPAFYRQCLEESYAELKSAVLGKRRR